MTETVATSTTPDLQIRRTFAAPREIGVTVRLRF